MAITRVSGQTTGNSGFGTSLTLTLTNAPTAGNLVVIGGSANGAPTSAVSVADSNSNSYTASTTTSTTGYGGGSNDKVGIWYLANAPANASKTITITWTGSSANIAGWAAEYAGAATASVFEADASNRDGGTTANCNLPSLTPSNDNDLVVHVAVCGGTMTSIGGSFTQVENTRNRAGYGDVIQTTATTATPGDTSTTGWSSLVGAFKVAASGDTLQGSQRLFFM